MKLSEIQICGRYHAKVSGQVQVVRVIAIEETAAVVVEARRIANDDYGGQPGDGGWITIRSPQRLRRAVED